MRSVTFCVFVAAVVAVEVMFCEELDWACELNVPYKENECNNCTCVETKKLKCGDKGCLDLIESKLFNCVVGTKSVRKCNKCVCIKDIGTICTNWECPDEK